MKKLQNILQNSLARAVTRTPKSSHITPVLKSLHWLKINERIKYKLLSLTYKVLTTTNLSISTTRSLFNLVTTHVLHLWSLLFAHLPTPLWKSQIAPLGMLHPLYGMNSPLISASLVRHNLLHFLLSLSHGISSSSPSSLSLLASSLTCSVFHSELKTWLFSKSFPP